MYAADLAARTNRDLTEALSVIKPPQTPLGQPPGAPPAGPLPIATVPPPSPLQGAGPSPLAVKPPQSMAMTNLSMRPPTQNPIMGGLSQVKSFAKGGRVTKPRTMR